MSNVQIEICQFVKENYVLTGEMDALDADQSLMEQGVIDSIGVFALIDFIEQRYGINLSDDEITPENLDSLNRIVAFVNRKCSLDQLNAA